MCSTDRPARRARRRACSTAQLKAAHGEARAHVRYHGTQYVWYACLTPRSEPRVITRGDFFGGDVPGGFRLNDRFVAYEIHSVVKQNRGPSRLERIDLASGERLSARAVGPPTEIELSEAGSVLWIEGPDHHGRPQPYRVRHLAPGVDAVLDEQSGIDPGSLAVSGGRAYWIRDGQPRSTTLAPPSEPPPPDGGLPAPRGLAAAAAPACKLRGSRLLLGQRYERVYARRAGDRETVYGCAHSRAPRRILSQWAAGGEPGVAHLRQRGSFAAAQVDDRRANGTPRHRVVRVNLVNGRRMSVETGMASDLELGRDGRVAWLADGRVHAADHTGRRELGAGAIDPDSLAISGLTVFWMQDGQPRAATLR